MKTKFKYFNIGEDLFYNNGDFCIRIRVNSDFPTIESLEDYNVEYYNKNWSKHIIEISEELFNKRFAIISELLKSRINGN